MKGEILFIAHRMPFPPNRGDKIRSHHVLQKLVQMAPVHVATFAESESDLAEEGALAAVAASHCVVQRKKILAFAGAEALARGEPVSLAAFRDAQLMAYVQRTLAERPIEAIYVFSGQMGQYVPANWDGRVVIDLVDVDSAKFEAYSQESSGAMHWLQAREGRMMRAEEIRLTARADRVLLISEPEAAMLRSRVSADDRPKVATLRNGIDADQFDPAASRSHVDLAGEAGPQIVFTGQMDYAPNIAAVRRAAERLMPRIRQSHPAARFHVVGRAPTREVLALDGHEGVTVWGEVADVRPFLAAADIVLVPLGIARGVQNKVLEAMAMGRPVVLTPGAATGIEATDDVHFGVAETDDLLVERTLELLADPSAATFMGQAARAFVVDNLSWPAVLAPLETIMGPDPLGRGRRDAA